ncbi:MAG: hypothetical protein OXI86_07130, partial [Candidatus Poribacteria bacterium]|nr:hypothetical protein [Candidatus Poribacteria bacterium]
MKDYQPLDLSALCNAGLDILNEEASVSIGEQTLRGLPFLVGSSDSERADNCFIGFDAKGESVTIPINRSARRVIIAHALLESELSEGGALAKPIADYVFRVSGGDEIRVPIRERFEIAIPTFGGLPFRALSDQLDSLYPRDEGRWEDMGRRQTEAAQGRSRGLFLWSWENPQPDSVIESLEIVPGGTRFIVAAITLGHADEHPFVRQGRREARITLTNPEDAEKPFDLDVEVDRGLATYVHALPVASAEEFADDSFKGWGEAQNPKSSPAYTEIAALPSATVTVKQGEEEVGKVNWGDVQEKGAVNVPRMRVE